MPDEDFRNDPNHPELVEPSTYVAIDPNRFSSEPEDQKRLARLSQQVRRLSTWLGVLTGASILTLGLLIGFAFWLKRQNDLLTRQVSTLNTYKAEFDRIGTLEGRIIGLESQANSLTQNQILLNKQIPKGLASQLKVTQNNISALQTAQNALQRVLSQTMSRQEVEQSIQRALKVPNQPTTPASPFTTPPRR